MVVRVPKLLAVEAGCEFIVTHNVRHFARVEQFGLRAVTSREFLEILGEFPWVRSV